MRAPKHADKYDPPDPDDVILDAASQEQPQSRRSVALSYTEPRLRSTGHKPRLGRPERVPKHLTEWSLFG